MRELAILTLATGAALAPFLAIGACVAVAVYRTLAKAERNRRDRLRLQERISRI